MNSKLTRSPQTSWRERHNELITSVRAARRAAKESDNLNENVKLMPKYEKRACDKKSDEYISELVNNICGRKKNATNGPAPLPILMSRIPASMFQADAMRKANIASGGRAARGRVATINTQANFSKKQNSRSKESHPLCGFGSSVERFGAVDGQCESVHILDSNGTSIGMQQAFGKVEEYSVDEIMPLKQHRQLF